MSKHFGKVSSGPTHHQLSVINDVYGKQSSSETSNQKTAEL